jgi:pyrimidine-nucleoside phosphorylase
VLRGLDHAETFALTDARVHSGDRIDMSSIGRKIVDQHSTGGVGDKVSIALGPIVAACGVPFGKMSGRGLGHTGGTLDKLESIPGFSVELSESAFLEQVQSIGVAICGQTADNVPPDRHLYALRDVTGTVENIPLIAASIMSKKLAAGADAIVLDVKVGSGAFMKRLEDARVLADTMVSIGQGAGREVRVLLTDMDAPLGRAIGNALEIAEVVDLLKGGGPSDLRELVFTAAGALLGLSDLDVSEAEGRKRAENAVADGRAYERYREWITAQGGDPDAPLPEAPVKYELLADRPGVIKTMDALEVGLAACRLGAGRLTKADEVDHAVGIVLGSVSGERVEEGALIATIHARSLEAAKVAAERVHAATNIDRGTGTFERGVLLERRG